MRITKYGHCCMLVEERGVRILTDPGSWTREEHESLRDMHIVLFTHEHADHYHLESLTKILANNPIAKVVCNPRVGALLDEAHIPHTVVGDGAIFTEKELSIEGHGSDHAPIHASIPLPKNTGYFIGERFWYPGDALHDPKRAMDILALPVAGPWLLLSSAIDYALAQKPKIAFPVHDMLLSSIGLSIHHRVTAGALESSGIRWAPLTLGQAYDF
ncbi:MBL fold metallo-hydrolase [Candidatus Kaiserbacteria bacterium]|nr:MBL fold metallo-hydrolase [Candidatus Kaiserbacteria bacterium]